jgi:hypothetical protein
MPMPRRLLLNSAVDPVDPPFSRYTISLVNSNPNVVVYPTTMLNIVWIMPDLSDFHSASAALDSRSGPLSENYEKNDRPEVAGDAYLKICPSNLIT